MNIALTSRCRACFSFVPNYSHVSCQKVWLHLSNEGLVHALKSTADCSALFLKFVQHNEYTKPMKMGVSCVRQETTGKYSCPSLKSKHCTKWATEFHCPFVYAFSFFLFVSSTDEQSKVTQLTRKIFVSSVLCFLLGFPFSTHESRKNYAQLNIFVPFQSFFVFLFFPSPHGMYELCSTEEKKKSAFSFLPDFFSLLRCPTFQLFTATLLSHQTPLLSAGISIKSPSI